MDILGYNIRKCQICSSTNLHKFLSLGHHPPSDAFLAEIDLEKPKIHYSLDLYFCEECKLVQLGYVVDPKILFNQEYAYNTGTSNELIKNFSELTEKLVKEFNLTIYDLAVDIGSNDGTLLEGYKKYGVKVLGVEPTGVADMALKKSIPTIKNFFNKETAEKALEEYGPAKIITATNVFAHVSDLDGFVEGVKLFLSHNGIFISESHYLLNLIEKMQYDSIYHEHLRYYSLKPLMTLFHRFGMDVFKVELIETHGGSIRVYACKKGAYPISESVKDILKLEEVSGLYSKETFTNYKNKVEESRKKLLRLLHKIKDEGHKIVGIGAPAKGNTLLNYCNLDANVLDYLAEKSELKIGLYSPGMHIKVVDESIIFQEPQPPYALILSWNLKDIIIPKIRAKGYRGKIIIPVPEPHVVD